MSSFDMKEALSLPKAYAQSFISNPEYKWYKPILAFLLAVIFTILFSIPFAIAGYVLGLPGFGPETMNSLGDNYLQNDLTDPVQVFFVAAEVAVMIPAVALGMKIVGLKGLGTLSSVDGHIRWDRMTRLAGPIAGITLAWIVLTECGSILIENGVQGLANPVFAPAGLIAILLFIPFQCAAEEYAFRGLILKALGSWIPSVVVVVILQGLFFGLAHGYDILGNIIIFVDGILMGWLIIKTGGLEVAILMHASNNVVAMGMATIYSSASVTVHTTIESFIVGIIGELLVFGVAYYFCKRNNYFIQDAPEQLPEEI